MRTDLVYLDLSICRTIENASKNVMSKYYWDDKVEFQIENVEDLISLTWEIAEHEDIAFDGLCIHNIRKLCESKNSQSVIFKRDLSELSLGFGWFTIS